MPLQFRFDKHCAPVFAHYLHSRSDWDEIENTVIWLSSYAEWAGYCSALDIPQSALADAMSCAGYKLPIKVGLFAYSWHDLFVADYRHLTKREMDAKYPVPCSNYVIRHNIPRNRPKKSTPPATRIDATSKSVESSPTVINLSSTPASTSEIPQAQLRGTLSVSKNGIPQSFTLDLTPPPVETKSAQTNAAMQQTHSTPVVEEPLAESKLDDAFDRLHAIRSIVDEGYYIEVSRAVIAKLRPDSAPVKTPIWLTMLLRDHSIYDIMAALMRAVKRHE
jgi:hypothetical protein